METEQRIKELRSMFLQLVEVIMEELKDGKPVKTSDTFIVMKKIQAELEKLEGGKAKNFK